MLSIMFFDSLISYCLIPFPDSSPSDDKDCSICSDGYTEGIGFTCDKCFNRSGGIVLAVVMFGAAVFAITLLARYLVSEEFDHSRMGFLKSLLRYIPLQSVKIAIVSWQILTQVPTITSPFQRSLPFYL